MTTTGAERQRAVSLVDRRSPLPLWAQITDDLRRRVARGEFDRQFPTDAQLSSDYGVSRQTAREAVRRLQQDGVVVRTRGRGTTLNRIPLEQPLHSLYSMATSLRAQGIAERVEVRERVVRAVADADAGVLGLEQGADVLYVERLRFADREPISWERSWLPAEVGRGLLEADLAGGLYDALATHCGVRATGGWERIQPVVPSRAERRLLQLPDGVAAFAIERLARAAEEPVELRRSLVRGDRYAFVASWPQGA